MMSEIEEEPGPENEIPMYCCLEFSFAVYYKFITIDIDRNSIKIDLKSTLTLSELDKQAIIDRLRTEPLGSLSSHRRPQRFLPSGKRRWQKKQHPKPEPNR